MATRIDEVFTAIPAEEPRERRLDVPRLAPLSRVLRRSRTRQGPRFDRRTSVPKLVHGMGDGTHKLPVKAEIRRAIGKEAGDNVAVQLEERLHD